MAESDAAPRQKQSSKLVRWILAVGIVILSGALIVVATPPPPLPETIVIRTDGSVGTFTAAGDAVDSGRVCDGGVYSDQHAPGPPGTPTGPGFVSEFICDDRSALFRIRGQVVESGRFTRSEGTWRFVLRPFGDTPFKGGGRFFADGNLDEETLRITYIGDVDLSP